MSKTKLRMTEKLIILGVMFYLGGLAAFVGAVSGWSAAQGDFIILIMASVHFVGGFIICLGLFLNLD